jgi:hypothetical protein
MIDVQRRHELLATRNDELRRHRDIGGSDGMGLGR